MKHIKITLSVLAFAIFAFIDKISKKLDDVLTMDFTNFSKRKKKK